MILTKSDFGDDFVWGVSTAAYQIEGAHDIDDKGLSIWDIFTNNKGNVFENQNANNTCDFYHRFKSDLSVMKSMNIPNFRFSLSWPRIVPNGNGKINQQGVDFYNRLIDQCLFYGIEPWITIYHWDLPQYLERKGGWTNRDVLGWFNDYVEVCIKHFSDRVKYWLVLNEPMVFTGAGYFLGVHAPGRKGLKNFLPAAHHAALCQAEGGRIIKSYNSKLVVGTTFSCSQIEPMKNNKRDERAALKVDALLNRFFLEPALGMGYPTITLKLLERIEKYFKHGDESSLKFDFDFIGIQNYTRELVSHSYFTPLINAKIVKAKKRNVKTTLMGWEVHPPSIYHILKKISKYPQVKKIIVTENGAAFQDTLIDQRVSDTDRANYLKDHIAQVLRAKKEGINVDGYFVWTFTDNFEWAEGYYPRFGLVYVDFSTQKRIIKSSGAWYRAFLTE